MDLAVELAELHDALRSLTANLETLFRQIAKETNQRAELEAAVDGAQAALDRASVKHRQVGGVLRSDRSPSTATADITGFANLVAQRTATLEAARRRLEGFANECWASRLRALERAKARLKTGTARFVNDPTTLRGARWRGPLMQRVLQNGRFVTAAELDEGVKRAGARFLRSALSLASDVAAVDESTDERAATSVHERWCKAALLTRPDSLVVCGSGTLLDLWAARRGGDSEIEFDFQGHFRALRDAAESLPQAERTAGLPEWLASYRGLDDDCLLPPAKHICTQRATFRGMPEAREALRRDAQLQLRRAETELRQAFGLPVGADAAAKSTGDALDRLTDYRMARRAAMRDPVALSQPLASPSPTYL